MREFADLLDRLTYTPQRNVKLTLLQDYFRRRADPERGWALALLADELTFTHAKPQILRTLTLGRVEEALFDLSYDYVGDLAETIALIWPAATTDEPAPTLPEVVAFLHQASRDEIAAQIPHWFDALDANGRWALIKLITGSIRVGVSARLAKTALARLGEVEIAAIEEIWHGLSPPYNALFAWLEGKEERPQPRIAAPFRPPMLATPLEEAAIDTLDPGAYAAEWKWDGIRVQLAVEGESQRLYSRNGDEISAAFPDLLQPDLPEVVFDGELLVFDPTQAPAPPLRFSAAPFSALQKRLNRKRVTPALTSALPVFLRAYDLLSLKGEELRPLPFKERRQRLTALIETTPPPCVDLSPLVPFSGWEELAVHRNAPPKGVEGLMLKRWDSAYVPGRPKGPWFKWKRDPWLVDAVLLYAQRGHGKRSSFYSDYTFGVWDRDTLVTVGKAYFGFTDEELKALDRFIRNHTINRFGPVREVVHTPTQGLVLEIAFEGINASTRHKSGLALRFPRIHRIRWDKPPGEADQLQTLQRLLAAETAQLGEPEPR